MSRSLEGKLAILADAAKYDASCASSGSRAKRDGGGVGSTEGMGICHSYTPDGRCVSLLKILLTNYCIYDCKYCINRVSSNTPRARFTVDEVVKLTLDFYKRNYIEGLFLSSGIVRNPDTTMEQMVAVARNLRTVHGFKGYIHLKTIPGAHDALVLQAGEYADRLSVNIELPTEQDLAELAPEKSVDALEQNMKVIESKLIENCQPTSGRHRPPVFTPAGQSTQMIVGATASPDREILHTASRLYGNYGLRRVYYSAFSPIPETHQALPAVAPPLVREHRLYQADWLLRFYHFQPEEIVPEERPNLRLDLDPKTAWALENRDFFPVDLNAASRAAMLRVPGLGVRTVDRLLAQRKHHAIRWEDLRRLRCSTERLGPFVVTADRRPPHWLTRCDLQSLVLPPGEQLELAF